MINRRIFDPINKQGRKISNFLHFYTNLIKSSLPEGTTKIKKKVFLSLLFCLRKGLHATWGVPWEDNFISIENIIRSNLKLDVISIAGCNLVSTTNSNCPRFLIQANYIIFLSANSGISNFEKPDANVTNHLLGGTFMGHFIPILWGTFFRETTCEHD